jgi:hypothetical protein
MASVGQMTWFLCVSQKRKEILKSFTGSKDLLIPGLQSALKLADRDLYSNIHTIYKLLIVLPVTYVCYECSFSALCRLKTWVRSTMTGERLCGLAMLHSHRNMAVIRENILRRYDASGHHKIGRFFLWTTKTCSNLNSSYNYIKHICFELSFLTFIPALYRKTLI